MNLRPPATKSAGDSRGLKHLAALWKQPALWLALWLAIAALCVALYPPRPVSDLGEQLVAWDAFRAGGPFNSLPHVENGDLDRVTWHFITWWSPGPMILVGGGEFVGLTIGNAMGIWLVIATAAQLTGWNALYRALGFDRKARLPALIVCALSWHSLYGWRIFGGEVFALAATPWAAIALLRLRRAGWLAQIFGTLAIVLAAAYLKLSLIVTLCGVGLGIYCQTIDPTSWKRPWKGLRTLWPMIFGGGVALLIFEWEFLRLGKSPGSIGAVELTLGHLASATACAWILPWSSLVAGTSIGGRIVEAQGWPAFNHNPWWQAGGVIVTAATIWWGRRQRMPAGYRGWATGCLVAFVAAFVWFYATDAAVSYEDRHGWLTGLMLIPGLVAAAQSTQSRVARAACIVGFALGCTWGVLSYAHHLMSIAPRGYVGVRGQGNSTLDPNDGTALRKLATLVSPETVVLSDNQEALIDLRPRHFALLPAQFETLHWHGVNPHLVIVSAQMPQSTLAAAFAGASQRAWHYPISVNLRLVFTGPSPPAINLPWQPL
jgi:hypothetical protein